MGDLEVANEIRKQDVSRAQATSYTAHDYPSEAIWSIYISEASKWDKDMVEGWRDDMDGIMIFAALFSATVTAFIVESYKSLKPDSGAITIALLAQISHQLLAASNGVPVTLPSPTPENVPFQATSSSVIVNALWFLSLAFSLMCALAATVVKQWSRNYLNATRGRTAPFLRARIRSYLFEGLHRWYMPLLVNTVPLLLQFSLFLFFLGLFEFMRPINTTISKLTLGIVVTCVIMYWFIGISAALRRNCPYSVQLSYIIYPGLQILSWFGLLLFRCFNWSIPTWLENMLRSATERMEEIAMDERTGWLARKGTSRYTRDLHALRWTLESLTSNSELELFVQGIPGFLVSKDVVDGCKIMWNLFEDQNVGLERRVGLGRRIGLLLDSCSDISEPIARQQRVVTCITAIWSLTLTALPTNQGWISGFDFLTLERLEQRLTDPDTVTADWAKCTLVVALCRTLQDTSDPMIHPPKSWYEMRDLVHDLINILNAIQRYTDTLSLSTAKCWTTLSTRASSLSVKLKSVKHTGLTMKGNVLWLTGKQFADLLKDARLLSLVNLIAVITKISFDPFTLIGRSSRSQQHPASFSAADDSEYHAFRHLRGDLKACARDADIQACLVEAVSHAIDLEEVTGDRRRIHPIMMKDMLILVQTIDDPGCLGKGDNLVQRYSRLRPDTAATTDAANALDRPLLPQMR